jgi:hypothetical protein
LEGKYQVQQDERIGIPVPDECKPIQNNPNAEYDTLDDDKTPGANSLGNPIGNRRATRQWVLRRDTGGLFSAKFS